jgi:hypothetical protein
MEDLEPPEKQDGRYQWMDGRSLALYLLCKSSYYVIMQEAGGRARYF